MRLTKPILEHVHGKGGWLLLSGFLIPPRVSRKVFAVVVRRRNDIVPRFAGSCDTTGLRRGV